MFAKFMCGSDYVPQRKAATPGPSRSPFFMPSPAPTPKKKSRRRTKSKSKASESDESNVAVNDDSETQSLKPPTVTKKRACSVCESDEPKRKRRRKQDPVQDVTTQLPTPPPTSSSSTPTPLLTSTPSKSKSTSKFPPRPFLVVPADQPVLFPSHFASPELSAFPKPASAASSPLEERTEDMREDEPFNPRWSLAVRLIMSQPPLVQLSICHDPWRVLVATLMLNKTNGKSSLPVFWHLMSRWPSAAHMQHAPLHELVELLRPLGFQNFRSARLIQLSAAYIAHPPDPRVLYRSRVTGAYPPTAVSHLPGAGRYALDSYRMFCLPGDEWRYVRPRDKELVRWMEWRWATEGFRWSAEHGVLGPIDDAGCVAVITRCGKPDLACIPGLDVPVPA